MVHSAPQPLTAITRVPLLAVKIKTYKRKLVLRGNDIDTLYSVLIPLLANLIHGLAGIITEPQRLSASEA